LLTKIIVGIGLVELRNMPQRLDRLAQYMSRSMGKQEGGEAFTMAMAVFFSIAGSLFGYLVTRLFLQQALSRADRAASADIEELQRKVQAVEGEATHARGRAADASRKAAVSLFRSAVRGTATASETQPADLEDLVDQYDRTRGAMPPGDLRNTKLDQIVREMVAAAARTIQFGVDAALADLQHNGHRVAAYAYLLAHPDLGG
jgi:hypothetical protein